MCCGIYNMISFVRSLFQRRSKKRSRSPSPPQSTLKRSKSPSPRTTLKQQRSRSPSPKGSDVSSAGYATVIDDTSDNNVLSGKDFRAMFRIRPVRGDGNCFFYALSYSLFGQTDDYDMIRQRLCNAYESERQNRRLQQRKFVYESAHKLRCLSEPDRERDICNQKIYADVECDAFMCSLEFKVDIIILIRSENGTYLVDRYSCPPELKRERTKEERELLPERVYLHHNGSQSQVGGHIDALEFKDVARNQSITIQKSHKHVLV